MLTHTPDVAEIMPTWSPDGTKLAFWILRNDWIGLHVMNTDGTDEREMKINWPFPAGATMPDWFPDGQKLIFSAVRY
jgi:TolB protein